MKKRSLQVDVRLLASPQLIDKVLALPPEIYAIVLHNPLLLELGSMKQPTHARVSDMIAVPFHLQFGADDFDSSSLTDFVSIVDKCNGRNARFLNYTEIIPTAANPLGAVNVTNPPLVEFSSKLHWPAISESNLSVCIICNAYTLGGSVDFASVFVTPAIVAAVVSIIAVLITNRTTRSVHKERLELDLNIAERKAKADIHLAQRKFELDRELATWNRKVALAETVLEGFYRARSIFQSARQPYSRGGEGATRPREPGEDENISSFRDSQYAPLERLSAHLEFLSELNAQRFRFAANFGADSEVAFQALTGSYNRVRGATHVLVSSRGLSSKLRDKYEEIIGWGTDDDSDTIASEIDKAVAQIEDLCKPILQQLPS